MSLYGFQEILMKPSAKVQAIIYSNEAVFNLEQAWIKLGINLYFLNDFPITVCHICYNNRNCF